MNIDEIGLTKLLVFGSNPPSPDYNRHIRPENAEAPVLELDMGEYMATGAGRYALPSRAQIVESFFNEEELPNGTYTAGELLGLLNLEASDTRFPVVNYETDIYSADFVERAYVFGSSSFSISVPEARFVVEAGERSIRGLEVRALEDDFDFQSSSGLIQIANDRLAGLLDPYGLIPVDAEGDTTGVRLVFVGEGAEYATYTEADFRADQEVVRTQTTLITAGLDELADRGGVAYARRIDEDDLFRYYRGDLKVVYGTPRDDTLSAEDAEAPLGGGSGYLLVGGGGEDTISGGSSPDELLGGSGGDFLYGRAGSDTLVGGGGNDVLQGGLASAQSGNADVAVYEGPFAEYEVDASGNGNAVITDARPSRNGSDRLAGIDFVEFADRTIQLDTGRVVAGGGVGAAPGSGAGGPAGGAPDGTPSTDASGGAVGGTGGGTDGPPDWDAVAARVTRAFEETGQWFDPENPAVFEEPVDWDAVAARVTRNFEETGQWFF